MYNKKQIISKKIKILLNKLQKNKTFTYKNVLNTILKHLNGNVNIYFKSLQKL